MKPFIKKLWMLPNKKFAKKNLKGEIKAKKNIPSIWHFFGKLKLKILISQIFNLTRIFLQSYRISWAQCRISVEGDFCHCCTNALFSKLFWALVNDLPWLFIGVCSWCEAVQNRNEELLLPDFCSFEVGGFFRVEITRCTNEWVEWCVTQEKGNSRRVGTHYNLNNTNLTPLM